METVSSHDADEVPNRDALFLAATKAAEAGDPVAMLEALYQTGILDGIPRYIAAHWSDFDFADASIFVAAATDDFFSKVRSGHKIRNVSAYLFKVALNKASDEYEEKSKRVPLEEVGDIPDRRSTPAAPPLPREVLKKKALQLARQFLNELGQENVQKVMAIYFDAIDKGIGDIATADVAELLGLTEEAVRQCRSRGWRRLRRVAKEHGVNLEQALTDLQTTEEYDNDNE